MTPPSSDPTAAPTAVVFDLGGVVFRYRPERRLSGLARAAGLSEADVGKRLMSSGYSRACDAGRLNRDLAHREGTRLLGARLSRETFERLWISAFEPDPAVVDLAGRLRSRRRLAMLSNNSALVRAGLEASHGAVLDLFRPRLFSAEVGVLKPDPRLFQTLLDLLDLTPDQVLYLDDEPACVAAAAAIGMTAWRFQGAADLDAALRARGWLA